MYRSLSCVIGDDLVAEGAEVCSGQRLGHTVGVLLAGLGPDESELLVTTTVVVEEEVVTYSIMTGVLRG